MPFFFLSSCNKDDANFLLNPSNSEELAFNSLNHISENIRTQIEYYDPDYSKKTASFIASLECENRDLTVKLIEAVKLQNFSKNHNLLWSYAEKLDPSIIESVGKSNSHNQPNTYMVPVVNGELVFDITEYLYFQISDCDVLNMERIDPNGERYFDASGMLRQFFTNKILLNGSRGRVVSSDRLYFGPDFSTSEISTQKSCTPILGATIYDINEARFTGFGDVVYFGDPGNNDNPDNTAGDNYYYEHGVTFDYFATGQTVTRTTVIGNDCSDDWVPSIPTVTTSFNNGAFITSTSNNNTVKPPCISAIATFKYTTSTEGAVVLKGWEFNIPGIIDANGNEVVVEIELDVAVRVGYQTSFITNLDHERTVQHMNLVLNRAHANAFRDVFAEHPSIYNDFGRSQFTGYHLNQSIKQDVIRSLRNTFITEMTRRDWQLDVNELNLEEAQTPYTDYDPQPGVTWMSNCSFTRP